MGNFLYAHCFSKITHLVLDDNFHIQFYLLGGPESKQRNSNPITQFFTLCKYRASEIRRRQKNYHKIEIAGGEGTMGYLLL